MPLGEAHLRGVVYEVVAEEDNQNGHMEPELDLGLITWGLPFAKSNRLVNSRRSAYLYDILL
jgi:hypothetical protein